MPKLALALATLLFTGGAAAITPNAAAAGTAGDAAAPAVHYAPNWASLDKRPAPEWFRDAKFGVFIHWGVYSVPAYERVGSYAEWYWNSMNRRNSPPRRFHERVYGKDFRYEDFAPRFTAELFDAKAWAKLFKRAGIRYVVPTSKHHDGFALWPSAEASRAWKRPWNAVEIGPKRDLLGEIAAATRAEGMRFGFYISLYEWYNPLWRADRARYVSEHWFPQFKDAVTRYQPSLIFADGEWDMDASKWRSEELLAWLYNDSPSRADVIVNDRWGRGTRHKHGGYYTTEYGAGLPNAAHPWEESRGMGKSYGYNRAERASDYTPSGELVFMLIDLVSRGGNFLLNIGPAADGTIPPIMEQRLLDIGAWLAVNGEAIYATRNAPRTCQWTAGTRPKQGWGDYKVTYHLRHGQRPRAGDKGALNAVKQVFYTKAKDADTLYAISAGWPGRELRLRDVATGAGGGETVVTLLGRAGAVPFRRDGADLVITPPDLLPEEFPCDYAYTFKITHATVAPEK
ncbi:MAG: alpha-L-fucosidase [Puniceicoccales bacterium]|jgi:alpha-L-fucosidase|nr:alpha-L-fucosidase [Puniceicoccales bacterium]